MSRLERFRRPVCVLVLAIVVASVLPVAETETVSRAQVSETGWPMAGANPQRTSWTAEAIDPTRFVVEWYRPIEAYIPQNVQIVAAEGLLYISSARGLYALDATTGETAWQFDTQLPVGHSPTVADGVVYFGGYDRKLHALDARTGASLWEFTGPAAGFSTNPLVVEGRVIAGNRDGVMYAVGAQGTPQQGRLLWSFNVGAPIYQSAAYQDGVIYFAAGDNRAYALRAADGALVWQSQTLPGEQYQSYWPVTYRGVVVFAAATQYRTGLLPGTRSAATPSSPTPDQYLTFTVDALWHDVPEGDPRVIGPPLSVAEPWAHTLPVVDASRVSEYLEDNPDGHTYLHKPYRRLYVVLNRADGSEYTQDVDADGHPDYAPIAYFGTKTGNTYPPVVLATDDVIYQNSLTGYTVSVRGRVVGWNMGTAQLSYASQESAGDEPQAISASGNTIYRSICCDRVGDWQNVATGQRSILWDYSNPLSVKAPGYDVMWWGRAYPGNLSGLVGAFGNPNGIYHSHGDQNPIVPYAGRLYVHRSNAIIAYGPGPGPGAQPLLRSNPVVDAVSPPNPGDLAARLETQVQRIVDAGNLNPAYQNLGQFLPRILKTAFENPGETLQALGRAYPYLSPTLQQEVKVYLRQQFAEYFNPTMYAAKGWSEGVPREAMLFPPDIASSFTNRLKRSAVSGWSYAYPQQNFYALWKYAEIVPEDAATAYALAKSKLEIPMPETELILERPYEHNAYIAGYIGFLNLQEVAGKATEDAALRAQVAAELDRILALRVSRFDKDTPYQDPTGTYPEGNVHYRGLNLARNFMTMVPELGEYLHQHAHGEVEEALAEYDRVGPYWFVSRYETAVDEGAMSVPYTAHALFQARAYALRQPYAELTKYLDAPSSAVGDLYYIENLVAALDAAGEAPAPTPTAVVTPAHTATVAPTPTRTPTRTATIAVTPTRTPTRTPTVSVTATRTPTRTATVAVTATRTPTRTATVSVTATRTPTRTATVSVTATRTPTPAVTSTATPVLEPTRVMHVGDLDPTAILGTTDRWIARVTIYVHDGEEAPMPDVLVSGVWSESKGEVECTTNSLGRCRLSASGLLMDSVPAVTFTIQGLGLAGYDYTPAQDHDPDGDSDGASIVVQRP